MMSMIVSKLLSKGMFALMGLGVLAYLIWTWGPLIRFGDVVPLRSPITRAIVIIVIFSIWGLIKLFRAWRDKKKSADISNDLAASADKTDPNAEQTSEELETLKERFDDALKTLKKSNVGGQKLRSIYQLPWYIIIGPPGSGKTTLLVNSGLQFPLADRMGGSKVQGIGGTRYCDWWFTDEAVLIDTAGRYTTQDSNVEVDNKAWFGFLKLLKKHRRRRPINGIILAISMEELARQNKSERENNAAAISNRIQELYEHLGVRFPVYLMFTKCDLMAGFMEFFNDLDRHERQQVWGFTNGLNDDPLEQFNQEFSALQAQLEARLIKRLQDERDVSRRELIYNFPMQMAASRDSVDEFLKRVFKPSRYTKTPMLRGIYFTSGTQEGTPFNRIMSQLARNFGLSRATTQSSPSKGKSFFIKDLMSKVIFGESGLAGANLKAERIYKLSKRVGLVMLLALPVLLNIGWWVSHGNNKSLASEVATSTEAVSERVRRVSPNDASLNGILPLLNEARAMPTGYATQSESVPVSYRMGLYLGKRLGDNGTIPAYQRLLENGFLPRLMVRMEQVLKDSQHDPDKTYQVLKAYLMLGNPDKMDKEFVVGMIQQDWDATLSRVMSADQITQLQQHLDALLEMDPLSLPFDLDNNLVMTARATLANSTLADRIYAVIKSDFIQEGAATTIVSAGGPDAVRVFVRASGTPVNQGVPAFFTPDGYQLMYLPAELKYVALMEDESWVFATTATQTPQNELIAGIRLRYFTDFTTNWSAFLEDIRIRPFGNLIQAAEILRTLTGNDSPLMQLLVNVDHATRLVPEVDVSDSGDDGISLSQRIEAVFRSNAAANGMTLPDPVLVDRSFAGLHALIEARPNGPSDLDGLLGDLQELYIYLDQLAQSSKDQLLSGLQGQASSAISHVRLRGQRSPAPVSGWIQLMVDESNSLVAGGAESHIKAAWSSDVSPFCRQALNGRYPFDNSSQREVQLRDFAAFFAPGGILDKFYNQYLDDIVDTNTRNWNLKSSVAGDLAISSGSLQQIQRAKKIQSAFFSGGGASPSISFNLRPVRMDPVTTNFMLNINGQITNYSHGPIFNESFVWPGEGNLNQVQIQFNPQPSSGRSGMTLVGPWSFFRLLDTAGMTALSTPEKFQTRLELDDRWAEYEISANSAFNPFNLPELRSFRCPDQL
jgi:type VI secretion system protein ImpL